MANRNCGRSRPARSSPKAAPRAGVPVFKEPEVRRWPHPVEGPPAAQNQEPTLHYVRCALSYQNQLLADIKTLLEQLAADQAEEK
ncbi:MAG: hypothetical protein HFF89_04620 [Oscillibacter sp.]|jgi:hypothetical protein|nr:hypothetical protein [Oscillibacter sp.]MCI8689670.1 hypothetical protein [Oscillibacter sp.]MCI9375530.1 hypothetical protein [Oscillibacter sp.]MCI9481298.1 hypothetical protein [Oscillibacter sp.]